MDLGISYGLPIMRIMDYWERGITGEGVKVLVIDSGSSPHRDLVIHGGDGQNAAGEKLDPLVDYYGHGTHVAGIIGAKPNINRSFAGIAPGCQLFNGKYVSGSMKDLLAGVVYALEYGADNDFDLINMSLDISEALIMKYPQYEGPLIRALERVKETKAIMVCSAGNVSDGTTDYLDRNAFVQRYADFVVGNMGYNKKPSSTSSMGSLVNCAGFGTQVWSTIMIENGTSNLYGLLSGTSMAAPQVTGILALYKELFPTLSKTELIEKAMENTVPLPDVSPFVQGKGIIMPPSELYSRPVSVSVPETFLRVPYGWESCTLKIPSETGYVDGEVVV
ncbi:S8 family peptidase [Enterococcus sp.]|uniref:S8 family peptidase n=1 Tax=Enterococcus sp. TaxID=35783 RepID=UPI003C761ED9